MECDVSGVRGSLGDHKELGKLDCREKARRRTYSLGGHLDGLLLSFESDRGKASLQSAKPVWIDAGWPNPKSEQLYRGKMVRGLPGEAIAIRLNDFRKNESGSPGATLYSLLSWIR